MRTIINCSSVVPTVVLSPLRFAVLTGRGRFSTGESVGLYRTLVRLGEIMNITEECAHVIATVYVIR
jgi:hypothetical protein